MPRTVKKDSILQKIGMLSDKQVLWIITGLAVVVFFVGITSPFQGDDNYQIVNNIPVHSIGNAGTLLSSSTFYNGQQLTGPSYRPMMTLTFALIYTTFKASPFAFHIVQLALYIVTAFLLFLILKKFFKPWQAFFCALIFLVHPLNSQVAFAIPSTQDTLFVAFGLLGLWLLLSYESLKGIVGFVIGLFLALLSKEIGILFAVIALLYLIYFDKKRIKTFVIINFIPILAYSLLRINAVGLIPLRTHIAPIDRLSFIQRLNNLPSVLLFYITKFVIPWKLSTRYFWAYKDFSIRNTLLPLLIDLAVISIFVYAGLWIKRNRNKKEFKTFMLFAVWAAIGILPYLQLYPIDMTASPSWFYFPMIGVLGMLIIIFKNIRYKIQENYLLIATAVFILALSVLTAIQGSYYKSPYKLAQHDLSASKEDYAAMGEISKGLLHESKYYEAADYAQRSIDIYPTLFNYQNLGVALQQTGDYPGAVKAYNNALEHGSQSTVYENLGLIALYYGTQAENAKTFRTALSAYPQNFKLWLYLAMYEDRAGDNDNAKLAINNAMKYGPVPDQISKAILNNQPFILQLPNSDKPFVVQ